MRTIGKRLQRLRKNRGWTQQLLAEKAKVAVTYVSRFENDEFKNPTTETIERFAKALDVTPVELQYGETLQMARDYLEFLKERPPQSSDAPAYIPNDIPEVGLAQAGRGHFFDDNGWPVNTWSRRHHRPADVTDPHAYILRVEGDSMEPFLRKGHCLICVTNRPPHHGDYVVVQLKSGEVMVKELSEADGRIILKSINPLHDPVVVEKSEIRAMHPVAWIKRK